MQISKNILAGALVSAAVLMSQAPASATPLGAAAGSTHWIAGAESDIVQVQARGRRGGGAGPVRGARGGRGGGRGDAGAAAAIGVIGIIGGMIAADAMRRQEAASYCASRFRSYDPQTGTYVGRDGRRRPCP